jgi:hypothetical protein
VAEDAEAGFGRVVGPAAGVDSVEPLGEDVGAALGFPPSRLGLAEADEERRLGVRLVAEAGEGDERAERQVLAGGEEGPSGLEFERLAPSGGEDGAILEREVRFWVHAGIMRIPRAPSMSTPCRREKRWPLRI